MLKTTFGKLTSRETDMALATIFAHKGFSDHKLKYRLAKMCKALDEEKKTIQKLYIDLLKQFVNLDKDGNIEPDNGQAGTYRVREDIQNNADEMEKYKKAFEDFKATEVEFDFPKIPISQLKGVNLSPMDLGAIEDFIIDMEEVSKPKE